VHGTYRLDKIVWILVEARKYEEALLKVAISNRKHVRGQFAT
jgi:hypothetical protein